MKFKKEKLSIAGDVIQHKDELGAIHPIGCGVLKTQDYGLIQCCEVDTHKAMVLVNYNAKASTLSRARLARSWLLRNKSYREVLVRAVHESVISSIVGISQEVSRDYSELVSRFETLIRKCTDMDASDVHFIVRKTGASVKARVLGELVDVARFDYSDMSQILASVYNQHAQAMSKDITFNELKEQRSAIDLVIGNHQYQLRFESKPIVPHEDYKVVVRLLKQHAKLAFNTIRSLQYDDDQVKVIEEALQSDNGLILLSGETGSGKTTTLATMLSHINHLWGGRIAIDTVESPVEYFIKGATQIPVHQGMNDTREDVLARYSRTISGLLRSDIDVVMIGEVSDSSSAKALQAIVQSGAKVLSSIHTSSALKVMGRLIGLGLEREVISEPDFLKLIIHQKLVPILCDQCALPLSSLNDESLLADIQTLSKRYGLEDQLSQIKVRNRSGQCDHCGIHNGIRTREVITETLAPSVPLLGALKAGDFEQAYRIWRKDGGIKYQERGIVKMFKGRICPQALLMKIGSFTQAGIFDHIDEELYPNILQGMFS